MHKLLILVALLPPLVSTQESTNLHVVAIKASNKERVPNGKTKWLLTEEKYMGKHPCAAYGVCDCWLDNERLKLTVNCSKRGLVEPPKMYKDLQVYELDLSENALQRAPNMRDEGYNSVRRLNLSGNCIKNVTADLISDNLEVLSLKNNMISRVDEAFLDKIRNRPNNKWLNLDKNQFKCDCETVAYVNLIRISTIRRVLSSACAGIGILTEHLSANETCPGQIATLLEEFKGIEKYTFDDEVIRKWGRCIPYLYPPRRTRFFFMEHFPRHRHNFRTTFG